MAANAPRRQGGPPVERQRPGLPWPLIALVLLLAAGAVAFALLFSEPPEREAKAVPPPVVVSPATPLAEQPAVPVTPPPSVASAPPAEPPEVNKPAVKLLPEVAVRQPGPAKSTQDPAVPAVPVLGVERRLLGGDAVPLAPLAATLPMPTEAEPDPPAGQSGFGRDAKTNCLVWLPSWRRGRQFAVEWQGACKAGRADGEGSAISRVLPVDHTPNRLAGHFRDGLYLGPERYDAEIVKLERDDFLIALPAGGLIGAQFWLYRRFATDLAVPLCGGADEAVLAVLPGHVGRTDNEAVQKFMRRAAEQARAVCRQARRVEVTVVPLEYGRVSGGSRTEFKPVVGSAEVYLDDKTAWQVTRYRNDEAALKEWEEKAARRKEGDRRAKEAALTRTNPDVRGVKLGMRLDQARAALGSDVAAWKPGWRPEQEQDPYLRRTVEVVLHDGARLVLRFVSSLSGGELVSVGFEQRYTTGPNADEAIGRVRGKYGQPDDVLQHSADAPWTGTWSLRSKAEGVIGAFLKAHVRFDRNSREVDLLSISVADVNWSEVDERAVYQKKRDEALRQHEQGKSDRMKF